MYSSQFTFGRNENFILKVYTKKNFFALLYFSSEMFVFIIKINKSRKLFRKRKVCKNVSEKHTPSGKKYKPIEVKVDPGTFRVYLFNINYVKGCKWSCFNHSLEFLLKNESWLWWKSRKKKRKREIVINLTQHFFNLFQEMHQRLHSRVLWIDNNQPSSKYVLRN